MRFEILHNLFQIEKGRHIYRKLKREYKVIYISQHKAIGDAYLIGSYLKNYIKENDVLTYIGKASKEIYELYEFKNLYELTQYKTNCLIKYLQFMEIPENYAKILHYQAIVEHTGFAFEFNGVNDLCFADLIEKCVFRNCRRQDRMFPQFNIRKEWSLIEEGNSVIIFPYANTLYTPSQEFWNEIIKNYLDKGKKVYTYVYENQCALNNTIPLNCNLKELNSMVEYAGEIIGVRNGLMDLIGEANCKKTIYYPKHGAESWIEGSILKFWSLKNFGYKTICNEVEWDT